MTGIPLALILALVTPADRPKAITAAEAKDHLGESCVVTMTVKSAKNSKKNKAVYLDSEEDFNDANNVAVVIAYDAAPAFKKAGIEDPAEYYRDKELRVKGTPKKEGAFVRIRITDPKAITRVEDK